MLQTAPPMFWKEDGDRECVDSTFHTALDSFTDPLP